LINLALSLLNFLFQYFFYFYLKRSIVSSRIQKKVSKPYYKTTLPDRSIKLTTRLTTYKMATSPPPPGVYVPVPTFFLPRSSSLYSASASPPDLETQAAHSLHLARAGITGLVLLGSTGEAIHLSNTERFSILSHMRKTYDENGFAKGIVDEFWKEVAAGVDEFLGQ